jgi:tRNA(Ile)-lysidine synthase
MGVAVSGGGDSTALLHLARDWAVRHGVTLAAATVDHGLRLEAKAEAEAVAAACAGLGVPHSVLTWTGWDGQGNLQAAARAARRALLTGWAEVQGLAAVLLGHTADDQAETVLMRLARGSGVDGLSGMAEASGPFLRPLLSVPRETLRDWLRQRGIGWAEDPSNDDPRFDRVRARRALAVLAGLGLTRDRLVDTAGHMARAQVSLWRQAAAFAATDVRTEAGDLILTPAAFDLSRSDSEGRILSAAIRWIGGAAYRPRHDALTEAAAAVLRGEARTLGGVRMIPEADGIRLTREASAVQGPVAAPGAPGVSHLWDSRWRLRTDRPQRNGLHIAVLTEAGLRRVADWPATGLPRLSLVTTPAVWDGETLLAAPVAGLSDGWTADLCPTFAAFLLSH